MYSRFSTFCTFAVAFLTLIISQSYGQIVLTGGQTANQLANTLIGPGITISNVTLNCPAGAYGQFSNGNSTNIGINSGVILTTGALQNVDGDGASTAGNTVSFSGVDNLGPGDASLNTIAGAQTYNACALEFDLVAMCDTIQISYVMGSEEYPEFVNGGYNDAFAFFISGPGIVGQQNIAVVPGTAIPVTIDNINNGTLCPSTGPCTNCAYYVDNCALGGTIEYDGFTTVLLAKSAVVPCSTYHLKLVIADGGDPVYDSGVFLEEEGIKCSSTIFDISASTNSATSQDAIEGCIDGIFNFIRSGDTTQAVTINYTVGGTATNGVDYPMLPGSVTIPANSSSTQITVSAFADGLPEGTETVMIIISDTICNTINYDTATILIRDPIQANAGPDDSTCVGGNIQIGAASVNGFTYAWTPAGGLSNTGISNPTATQATAGTYQYVVTQTDTFGCVDTDTVNVTFNPGGTVNTTVQDVSCNNAADGMAVASAAGGTAPYSYSWNTVPVQNNDTASGLAPGTYIVIATDFNGCTSSDTITITQPTPLSLTMGGTNVLCGGGTDGSAWVTVSGGHGNYGYNWSPGGYITDTITGIPAGTYVVTVTDTFMSGSSQVLYFEDFDGTHSWTLNVPTGVNGVDNNFWQVDDDEGGVLPTGCGVANNGDSTLHITSVFNSSGGAAYDAGGLCGILFCPQTNMRAESPAISTIGVTSPITLTFDFIANGDGMNDNASVWYNDGLGWTQLAASIKSPLCGGGQGQWTAASYVLPASCNNIANLQIGFNWTNNDDGIGSDPSVAINNVQVSSAGSGTIVCTAVDSITITEPTPIDLDSTFTNVTCNGAADGTATVIAAGGAGGFTYAWNTNPVQNTATATGLSGGLYMVVVTDQNGCQDSLAVTIQEPAGMTLVTTDSSVSCAGAADGMAWVSVSGGSTPYTYSWNTNPVQTTDTAAGLSGGTYIITVTDSAGCSAADTVTINEPMPLVINFNSQNILCNGDSTGWIKANVSGGYGNYGYNWSPGGYTTDSIFNLPAGTYVLTVTDTGVAGSGGVGPLQIYYEDFDGSHAWTLNVPTGVNGVDNNFWQVDDDEGGVAPTGCGVANNGDSTLHITSVFNSAGGAAYDAGGLCGILFCPQTNMRAESPAISTVGITTPITLNFDFIANGDGMNDNASVWYNDGLGWTQLAASIKSPLCGGGQGQWTAATYVLPASCQNIPNLQVGFNWTNNDDGIGSDPSVAINNVELMTTAGGGGGAVICVAVDSVTITEPTPLTLNISGTDVDCNGNANGTATVVANGGAGGYTYTWNTNPVQNTDSATGLSGGTYQVIVTDANGCSDSASITINEPAALQLSTSSTTSTCSQPNGTATVNVVGGTGGYSYSWNTNPPQNTQTATNLLTGWYVVTVTDGNGCTETDSVQVGDLPPPNATISSVTHVLCYGGTTGSATVQASGGTPPYNYVWNSNPPQNTATATNLAAGNYTVYVIDANNCVDSAFVTINQPSQIVLNPFSSIVSCNGNGADGSAGVTVSGGVPPYSYSWNTNPVQTTNQIFNLTPGDYTVTVTDANGCQQQITINVGLQPSPIVNAGPDASFCEGEGGANIFASGTNGTPPYYYSWWCNQPICGLDSINDNDPLANPTVTTTYYVQITDFNGCVSNIDSLVVTVLPKPKVDAGADITICGDSAPCVLLNPVILNDTAATGPYTYQWSPAAGLNNPNIFKPCARPDTTTIYSLVVTGGNGCSSTLTTTDTLATVTVNVNPVPVANAGPDQVLCFGDSLQLFGTGSGAGPGYQFEWSPGNSLSDSSIANPWASPALTTTYTLTVWSNGCPSYGDSVTITVDPMPTVAIQQPSDICLGEMLTLDGQVTNGQAGVNYTYQWYPATGIVGTANGEDVVVSPDTTTWYYFYAESPNGCRSPLDSVLVVVKPTPLAEAGAPMTICEGDSIRLLGNWYYSTTAPVQDTTQILFSWMPNDGSLNNTTIKQPWATPSTTTWYYLTVQYNTCSHTDSVLITVVPDLASNLESDTTTICEGDSVQLSATGGLGNAVFNWTPAQGLSNPNIANPMASPADTTTYWVTVSESGCYDSLAVTINVIPSPEMGYLSSLQEGCAPFTVNFLESSADVIQYIWDFGDGSSISNELNPSHTYTEPGTYQVSLTGVGIGGCEATIDDMEIKVHEPAIAEFTSDPEFPIEMPLPNTEVQFTDRSTNAVSWMWDFGDGFTSSDQNPNHTYQQEGSYTVTLVVENDFGCVSEVQHGPYIVITPDLQIPNVFTPNGDGENDKFFVRYTGNQPFTMQIYDRWGNLLFETNNKNEGWDGVNQNSGEVVPDGTYFYTVKIGKKAYANNLTLLR